MPDRKIVRGNFGRAPDEPAWDGSRHLIDPRTKEYNEHDVLMAVLAINGHRELLDDGNLQPDPQIKRGLEDAISTVLDGLNPEEQQEVLSRINQVKEGE